MQLISRRGQQAIDQQWQQNTGLPLLLLMEAAAMAVAQVCCDLVPAAERCRTRILVLAGRGQNGGDAFACARILAAEGFPVICRQLNPDQDLPPEAAANRQAWRQLGFSADRLTEADFDWAGPGLIVDGLFGTGFQADRGLPEPAREAGRLCCKARSRGARIVAIDLPSGLDSDSGACAQDMIKADHTVTFVRPKIGLYAAPGCLHAGEIHLAGIGVSDQLVSQALEQTGEPVFYLITPEHIRPWCPARPRDGHKGLFGHILILAGSEGMPGAAVLAARAAGRSGTGMVSLLTERQLLPAVVPAIPEVLVKALPEKRQEQADLLSRILEKADTVVIGPGLGSPPSLAMWLEIIIAHAQNLLIDADALNAMAREPEQAWQLLHERAKQQKSPVVLTPHPGEFRRLAPDLDLADRQQAALQLARRSASIVVLKGAATVIAHPEGRCWLNPTGHDGLARGGSGDVLSGLIGGLMAQGLDAEKAAVAGTYLHGLVAELVSAQTGRRHMLPTDLPEYFCQAFQQAGWQETASGRQECQ